MQPIGKAQKIKATKDKIKEANTLEEYREIKNYDWPEDIYTATRHSEGGILQQNKDADLVMWDERETVGIQTKALLGKYEDLRELGGRWDIYS